MLYIKLLLVSYYVIFVLNFLTFILLPLTCEVSQVATLIRAVDDIRALVGFIMVDAVVDCTVATGGRRQRQCRAALLFTVKLLCVCRTATVPTRHLITQGQSYLNVNSSATVLCGSLRRLPRPRCEVNH